MFQKTELDEFVFLVKLKRKLKFWKYYKGYYIFNKWRFDDGVVVLDAVNYMGFRRFIVLKRRKEEAMLYYRYPKFDDITMLLQMGYNPLEHRQLYSSISRYHDFKDASGKLL